MENLEALTGQKSGIVVYGNDVLVVDWTQMPFFAGSNGVYLKDRDDCDRREDVLMALPGGWDIIYDPDDKIGALLNDADPTPGYVWAIGSALVIAPIGWM